MLLPLRYEMLLYALTLSLPLSAQVKQEKEYKIKPHEVPEQALRFVAAIPDKQCLRWIYEENLEGNSVEAKFRYCRNKFSIEFDTTGQLQDVEILIDFDEVPGEVQERIENVLAKEYAAFKVKKAQIQFSGDPEVLLELAQSGQASGSYTTRYELVIKGKKERQKNLYEITFSQQGEMLSREEILFRNTDNLEY